MVTLDFEPKEIFVCVYHDIIFISLHNFTIREGKKNMCIGMTLLYSYLLLCPKVFDVE